MPDFNVRSDSVNVEQIMEQIRARIREKRGVDYTEEQIRELAAVKLEKFLDPRGLRSDLLDQFRRAKPAYEPPELPNYSFEDATLVESHRAPVRWIRKLLQPVLKLFLNPNPLIQALHIQSRLNTMYADREATRESARRQMDQLYYELIHNLVIETTRLGIEVKNLKMRVESLTGRLEFNERRARALESVVVYKPAEETAPPLPPQAETTVARFPQAPPPTPQQAATPEGPGQRSRRRRRRRGRRGGAGLAASVMAPSTVRESQGRPEDARGMTGPAQTPSEQMASTGPQALPSGTAATVEHGVAPEGQPNEPRVEGSTGDEPDSQ
jgi:hypothetical protein